MEGRLENKLKIEQSIDELLTNMPLEIKEYMYHINSKEPTTRYQYLRKIRAFLNYCEENFQDFNILNVSSVEIAQYMRHIETKLRGGKLVETSQSYRKQNYAVLNNLFDFFVKVNYYDTNPVQRIERPTRSDNIERHFLRAEDLNRILDAIDFGAGSLKARRCQEKWRTRDKAIMTLLIHTGMRETALTEINVENVDFEKKEIIVLDKGHKRHDYRMNKKMEMALRDWLQDRRQFFGERKTDAVFTSREGARMTAETVRDIVKKFSKEAIGKEVTPHKIRAALCNILLKQSGGDIYFVSKTIGHSRVETTKLYVDDDTKYHRNKAIQITEKIFD